MNLYSVFVPKLLSQNEPFVSGGCSCPGCGQASAVRIIGKAMEESGRHPYGIPQIGMETSEMPYSEWVFRPAVSKSRKGVKAPKNIVAMATESSCFDKGYEALKESKSRKKPFLYICFFNEAGIERHSGRTAESSYSHDETKSFIDRYVDINKKIRSIKALKPDFMATACPSHPLDLVDKVKTAMKTGGSCFPAVLVPCPTGCLYDPSQGMISGRMAVETGFFPLYQIDSKGVTDMNVPLHETPPVSEYLKIHPVYVLLDDTYKNKLQSLVDKNKKRLR